MAISRHKVIRIPHLRLLLIAFVNIVDYITKDEGVEIFCVGGIVLDPGR